MKRLLFHVSLLALLVCAVVFGAAARQAAPHLPPLHVDAEGRVHVGRGERIPADYAVAVAAAAQDTKTDPAFLFALAARTRYAAETFGASAGFDADALVGGPYAYGAAHWLKDLSLYGEAAGYPELADAIRSNGGTLEIADPELRYRAMTARTDPYLSSFLAAKAWRQAESELAVRRVPSEGLVMIAFLSGARFAEYLAGQVDKDVAAPLAKHAPDEVIALLVMTGLPGRDQRVDKEWTVAAFIDEITSRMRRDVSAYGVSRRIDVPDGYRPKKPMS